MERTDAQLIEAYHNGETKALDHIITQYTPKLYYFVARFVGTAVADDVLQEVWIKVWRFSRRFDPKKSFKVWLYSIAKNTCYDFLRKKQPVIFSNLQFDDDAGSFEDTLADERSSVVDTIAANELRESLVKVLELLPEKAQTIFTMHYQEDLSLVEIAEILNTPVNTVKSWHLRGLRLLREKIKPSMI